jgi:hypothetical protein
MRWSWEVSLRGEIAVEDAVAVTIAVEIARSLLRSLLRFAVEIAVLFYGCDCDFRRWLFVL